ncbi:MAG TPA: hypothetical protein VFO72_03845 [Pyrinomonadaceae bacterium]|nr:hypothetical protein [Pyrinomonadaceae bacterium]
MRNGDFFDALEGLRAGCDVMDRVEDLGAVISTAAGIADSDYDSFKDNKSVLVLERFPSNLFGPNGPLAVFALVTVRTLLVRFADFIKQ